MPNRGMTNFVKRQISAGKARKRIDRVAKQKLGLDGQYDQTRVARIVAFHQLRRAFVFFLAGISLLILGAVLLVAFYDTTASGTIKSPLGVIASLPALVLSGPLLVFAVSDVFSSWHILNATDPIEEYYRPKSWRRIEVKDFYHNRPAEPVNPVKDQSKDPS